MRAGAGTVLRRRRLCAPPARLHGDRGRCPSLPAGALHQDFFAYPEAKFATIIGNPPYVRYQDIPETTRAWLPTEHISTGVRTCISSSSRSARHLEPGGELIFITPRDFLKATSAVNLNRLLYEAGTITDFIELGDARIFEGATPNCAIWRFERGNSRVERATMRAGSEDRHFLYAGGHSPSRMPTTRCRWPSCSRSRSARCRGGCDLASDKHGTMDFVCSHTAKTGETKRMIFQTRTRR